MQEIKATPIDEWVFHSPLGDKIREHFQWNPEMTELVKVGEEDIQKAIDERAKGCTLAEQIARLARGDESVLQPGEGVYGDVYEFPETTGEALQVMEKKTVQEYVKLKAEKQAAKEAGDNKLQEKIAALEKELADLKGVKE